MIILVLYQLSIDLFQISLALNIILLINIVSSLSCTFVTTYIDPFIPNFAAYVLTIHFANRYVLKYAVTVTIPVFLFCKCNCVCHNNDDYVTLVPALNRS